MTLKRVVLLGPPGAGKGTQAKQIVEKLGLVHLSTGDILRDEVARETTLGKEAKGFMDRGDLVPDQLIIDMIRGRIEAASHNGFLLDGFPRTTAQAEALAAFASVDVVLNINLAREEVVRRLTSRRVCRECGAIYNLTFNLAEGETACAKCGGELYQRDDDKTDVIANRYDTYEKSTAPLIDFYTRQGILHTLDGSAGSEKVFSEIIDILTA